MLPAQHQHHPREEDDVEWSTVRLNDILSKDEVFGPGSSLSRLRLYLIQDDTVWYRYSLVQILLLLQLSDDDTVITRAPNHSLDLSGQNSQEVDSDFRLQLARDIMWPGEYDDGLLEAAAVVQKPSFAAFDDKLDLSEGRHLILVNLQDQQEAQIILRQTLLGETRDQRVQCQLQLVQAREQLAKCERQLVQSEEQSVDLQGEMVLVRQQLVDCQTELDRSQSDAERVSAELDSAKSNLALEVERGAATLIKVKRLNDELEGAKLNFATAQADRTLWETNARLEIDKLVPRELGARHDH